MSPTARGAPPQTYTILVRMEACNHAPIIVGQPPLAISGAAPLSGPMTTLYATVRDFHAGNPADFEGAITGYVPSLVQPILGADETPVLDPAHWSPGAGAITSAASFHQWYHDTPGVNLPAALPLEFTEVSPGSKVYEFADDDFFPIDDALFGNQGWSHNDHWTLGLHAQFTFQGDETLEFIGDDELWIFINKRLAVDLGGVRIGLHGGVNLSDPATRAKLGITPGFAYDIDLFYAERHTTNSQFRMTTGLLLSPNPPNEYDVDVVDPDGDPITYHLIEAPLGATIDVATSGISKGSELFMSF